MCNNGVRAWFWVSDFQPISWLQWGKLMGPTGVLEWNSLYVLYEHGYYLYKGSFMDVIDWNRSKRVVKSRTEKKENTQGELWGKVSTARGTLISDAYIREYEFLKKILSVNSERTEMYKNRVKYQFWVAAWEEISRHLLAWPTAQCHGALHTLPTSGWKRGQAHLYLQTTLAPVFQLAHQSTWRSADAMTHLFRDS